MDNDRKLESGPHRRKTAACLIAVSGVDCSGKSTQIAALIEQMRQRGERPCCLWLRVGYTPVFSALKNVLRKIVGKERMPQGPSPQRDSALSSGWKRSLWLHLAFLDMAFQTAVRIPMLKLLGRPVVCDRYIEDSEMDLILHFGDGAAQLPSWKVVRAIAAKPDLSIYLDLPFEDALERSIQKNEPFPDAKEKRLLRASLYEKLKLQGVYCIVDARMSVSETSAVISSLVFDEASDIEKRAGALS